MKADPFLPPGPETYPLNITRSDGSFVKTVQGTHRVIAPGSSPGPECKWLVYWRSEGRPVRTACTEAEFDAVYRGWRDLPICKEEEEPEAPSRGESLCIRVEYLDGTHSDLEVGRVTVLHKKTDKVVMHLDRLPDGKHLLICAEEVVPEGKRIDCLRFVRSGGEHVGPRRLP